MMESQRGLPTGGSSSKGVCLKVGLHTGSSVSRGFYLQGEGSASNGVRQTPQI